MCEPFSHHPHLVCICFCIYGKHEKNHYLFRTIAVFGVELRYSILRPFSHSADIVGCDVLFSSFWSCFYLFVNYFPFSSLCWSRQRDLFSLLLLSIFGLTFVPFSISAWVQPTYTGRFAKSPYNLFANDSYLKNTMWVFGSFIHTHTPTPAHTHPCKNTPNAERTEMCLCICNLQFAFAFISTQRCEKFLFDTK